MKYTMILPKVQEFEVDVYSTKKKINQVNVLKVWKESEVPQGNQQSRSYWHPKNITKLNS